MGEQQATGIPESTKDEQRSSSAAPGTEPPVTLGQKIFLVVLYLYVASLIWLVLSHHWYGVLPTWLDPH
jgi:uncharacterized ion transporter superfamily protein YfcC